MGRLCCDSYSRCGGGISAYMVYVFVFASLQMGEQNIMVTNVCPGPVQTSVDVNAFNPDGSKYNRTDPMISNGMTSKRCCFFCNVFGCYIM